MGVWNGNNTGITGNNGEKLSETPVNPLGSGTFINFMTLISPKGPEPAFNNIYQLSDIQACGDGGSGPLCAEVSGNPTVKRV